MEYESGRDARSPRHSRAVTIKPGWEFAKGRLINVAALLRERNEDASTLSDGTRPRETKFFVRLRHSGNLDERWGYYIRGGVGRSVSNERKFTYAYMEPGLKYEFGSRWQSACVIVAPHISQLPVARHPAPGQAGGFVRKRAGSS